MTHIRPTAVTRATSRLKFIRLKNLLVVGLVTMLGAVTLVSTGMPMAATAATITSAVGANPNAVAATPNGTYAYVLNREDESVSVVTVASGAVSPAVIKVGATPLAIAISPDGNYVMVANGVPNTVSVISTSTNTVTATVAVGTTPAGIAFTPDSQYAYETNNGDNSVGVLSLSAGIWSYGATTIPVGAHPRLIAIDSNAHYAFVVSGAVSVISLSAGGGTNVGSIAVGTYPFGVAVTPDSSKVYVTNSGDNTVSVISSSSLSVTATVSVGAGPQTIAASPDGQRIYVSAANGTSVSMLTISSNAVSQIMTGNHPAGVAITPYGMLIAANSSDNTVSIIAASSPPTFTNSGSPPSGAMGSAYSYTLTTTGPQAATFALNSGTLPSGLSLNATTGLISGTPTTSGPPSSGGAFIFTVLASNGTLPNTVSSPISIVVPISSTAFSTGSGTCPTAVAITPDGLHAYVASSCTNTVSVLSIPSGTVTATLSVGSNPVAIAITPDGKYAYVANQNSNTASFITLSSGGGTVSGTTISLPYNPVSVSINSSGTKVLFADNAYSVVSFVNVAAGASAAVTNVSIGSNSTWDTAAVFSPDGNYAFVVEPNQVDVLSMSSLTVVQRMGAPGGAALNGISIAPNGLTALVSGATNHVVYQLSISGGTIAFTTSATFASGVGGMAITADSTRAIVSNTSSSTGAASLITLAGMTVDPTPIAVGTTAKGVAITPNGSYAVVANSGSSTITIMNIQATPALIKSTPPSTSGSTAYSYTFTASGAPLPTFSLDSGSLPPGLTLNSTTGVLSGTTSTTLASYTFTVRASNGLAPDAVSPSRTMSIGPSLLASIASAQLTKVAFNATTASSATGALVLSVTDPTGFNQGWNVSVLGSSFVYSGNYSGGTIPASAFQLVSTGAITLVSGQAVTAGGTDAAPTGPQQAAITAGVAGSLAAARPVFRAGAGSGAGSYTQALNVSLAVPANAAVGLYTSTLTVTIASGP